MRHSSLNLVDAVIFDLLLVGETKFLFNLNFNRQAVGIPTAAAADMVTAHGLVAREDILEGARQHMVHARLAVGGRRTFIKDIFRPALAFAEGALEDILVFPKRSTLSSI